MLSAKKNSKLSKYEQTDGAMVFSIEALGRGVLPLQLFAALVVSEFCRL